MANPLARTPSGRRRGRRRTIVADGPHPIDVHVGSRIRLQRIVRGLTQSDLATLVGISFQSVQKYERGENRVSASRLHEFAEALSVGEQYFFEGLTHGAALTGMRLPTASEGKELQRQLTAVLSIEDRRLRSLIIQLLKLLTELGGGRLEGEESPS
jgi:transcriptional regulator with XRE-family HTH domain